jgi:hypothetical protein
VRVFGPNLGVLAERKRYSVGATGAAALADELRGRGRISAPELFLQAFDRLVDLAIEGFVPGGSRLCGRHATKYHARPYA